jgi:hypothetical protein
MDGNIFNSPGIQVAIVRDPAIFDLRGKKLYDLKASMKEQSEAAVRRHEAKIIPIGEGASQ